MPPNMPYIYMPVQNFFVNTRTTTMEAYSLKFDHSKIFLHTVISFIAKKRLLEWRTAISRAYRFSVVYSILHMCHVGTGYMTAYRILLVNSHTSDSHRSVQG